MCILSCKSKLIFQSLCVEFQNLSVFLNLACKQSQKTVALSTFDIFYLRHAVNTNTNAMGKPNLFIFNT